MKAKNDKKKKIIGNDELNLILFSFLLFISLFFIVGAAPSGPGYLNNTANSTLSSASGVMINTTGGYISTINITASSQNLRWKAFVGYVSGSLTLDDATGATIYDWSLASFTGEIYATRNSSTIQWTSVNCSNITNIETENLRMNHTNSNDNITATFYNLTNHSGFYIGTQVYINPNSCRSLNTYVENSSQDVRFEETVLFDNNTGTTIYASILESNQKGYSGANYDFQVIVPENGLPTWTGATAYYIYTEIS